VKAQLYYHFTRAQHAINDISLKRIKISRITELNDPYEFMGAAVTNDIQINAQEKAIEEQNKSEGIICFSKSFENPVLWSHYADSHRGICLGFDIPDADHHIFPVKYIDKPFKPNLEINGISAVTSSSESVYKLYISKFNHWLYENEARWFIPLNAGVQEADHYFYLFSKQLILREVILGVRCELPISNIEELVRIYECPPKVFKAKKMATEFKIEKQLRY
jgi:hypothetical protein